MSTPAERKFKRAQRKKEARRKFRERQAITGLSPRPERRQQPRGAFRAPPSSSTGTTTGLPEQGQEGQDPLLTMLGMKEGYKGGQEIREGITSGAYADKFSNAYDRVGDWFNVGQQPDVYTALPGTYSSSVPGAAQTATQGYAPGSYAPNVNPRFAAQFPQAPIAGGPQSYGAGLSGSVPTDFGIQGGADWGSAIANTGAQGSTLMGSGVGSTGMYAGGEASGLLADSTGAMAGEGLGTGLQAGADASSTAAGAGMLSKAGSLAGVGLNIYDMTQGGVNPGNVLGLAGSGMVAASAFNPALAAMGPWGWAAMGAGMLGSYLDWW
jgi:hypothetical protein